MITTYKGKFFTYHNYMPQKDKIESPLQNMEYLYSYDFSLNYKYQKSRKNAKYRRLRPEFLKMHYGRV